MTTADKLVFNTHIYSSRKFLFWSSDMSLALIFFVGHFANLFVNFYLFKVHSSLSSFHWAYHVSFLKTASHAYQATLWFCTFSSSILHDFHRILETDSNPMRKYKKSEKLHNADWGIKSHMQCKWVKIKYILVIMPKKVTHLCCQALSDWSYASLCTLTSSMSHNFYRILETDSNPTQKYKESEKLYNVDRGIKKSYAVQMRFCNTNESK